MCDTLITVFASVAASCIFELNNHEVQKLKQNTSLFISVPTHGLLFMEHAITLSIFTYFSFVPKQAEPTSILNEQYDDQVRVDLIDKLLIPNVLCPIIGIGCYQQQEIKQG